ncbi:LOG family protein [Pleurocapsa sp. PCC 7319]|uniref:LOG family protein n=1 Tax=Pleurocapsa sp. PCC 7319 TaxID=118161 RepID=UPI000346D825|nr:LOG family protein [Pleurocapsa sp. PCC 7319]
MSKKKRSLPLHCNLPQDPDAVSIADSEAAFEVVHDTILNLWDTVNKLSSIQPPRRERYRVTLFGSARIHPNTPIYSGVRHLASELTKMGCDIVTGGGPGLMQAANEGSVSADPEDRTQSIGIRVDLGFEQDTNPFVEQAYLHRTFFSRLHHFVLSSDAFVVLPGGIGTALEALMIWQLLQVRKLQNTPFIMVGTMWSELTNWAQQYTIDVEPPMADPADISIPHCVDSCDEAIALLREAHEQWQACNDRESELSD